jgi:hypothetical protein
MSGVVGSDGMGWVGESNKGNMAGMICFAIGWAIENSHTLKT